MPPATADAASVTALVKGQAVVRDNVNAQAAAIVTAATASFTGWYDTAAITEWTAALAARVEPLQRFLASSTDAYLARLISMLTGGRFRPVGRIDVTQLRPGMTPAGAYGNVADTYRWQQAQLDQLARELTDAATPTPPDLQSPAAAAVERATSVAEMDTQLAVRAQARETMAAAHERGLITGYRRVIHPELSRGGTCGLCVAASHRIYHVADLMPIHHRCNCLPTPVVDGNDVGSVINDDDLKRLYADAGSTNRKNLKATRYQVTDAGALGPLLEPEGAKRRVDRQAARRGDRPAKSAEQKLADLRKVRDSLTPALAQARQLAGDDPAKWGNYRDSVEKRITDLDAALEQLAA